MSPSVLSKYPQLELLIDKYDGKLPSKFAIDLGQVLSEVVLGMSSQNTTTGSENPSKEPYTVKLDQISLQLCVKWEADRTKLTLLGRDLTPLKKAGYPYEQICKIEMRGNMAHLTVRSEPALSKIRADIQELTRILGISVICEEIPKDYHITILGTQAVKFQGAGTARLEQLRNWSIDNNTTIILAKRSQNQVIWKLHSLDDAVRFCRDGFVSIDGKRYTPKPHDMRQDPLLCFRCGQPGHWESKCNNPFKCAYCSKGHGYVGCKKEGPAKCPQCNRAHPAWAPDCPNPETQAMFKRCKEVVAPRWAIINGLSDGMNMKRSKKSNSKAKIHEAVTNSTRETQETTTSSRTRTGTSSTADDASSVVSEVSTWPSSVSDISSSRASTPTSTPPSSFPMMHPIFDLKRKCTGSETPESSAPCLQMRQPKRLRSHKTFGAMEHAKVPLGRKYRRGSELPTMPTPDTSSPKSTRESPMEPESVQTPPTASKRRPGRPPGSKNKKRLY
ncbi:unnamed protein product [Clonostachys solani]|uniref:CCHC-type domain-containing protein n=1 Tax=Clonostachys solani TaxID=160281 RepID=A0A9P0ET85_9HYPO|nr:unnamed protein product [Clonostachys solani]